MDSLRSLDVALLGFSAGVILGLPVGLSASPVVAVSLPLTFAAVGSAASFLFLKGESAARREDETELRAAALRLLVIGFTVASLSASSSLLLGIWLRTGRVTPSDRSSQIAELIEALECPTLVELVERASVESGQSVWADPVWRDAVERCAVNGEHGESLPSALLGKVIGANAQGSPAIPGVSRPPFIEAGAVLPGLSGRTYRIVRAPNGAVTSVSAPQERGDDLDALFDDELGLRCIHDFSVLADSNVDLKLDQPLRSQLPVPVDDGTLAEFEEGEQSLRYLGVGWSRETIFEVCTSASENGR